MAPVDQVFSVHLFLVPHSLSYNIFLPSCLLDHLAVLWTLENRSALLHELFNRVCFLSPTLTTLVIFNKVYAWQPTPVLLPGKSHGQRSQVGCSPWGHRELDMTDFTFTMHPMNSMSRQNDKTLKEELPRLVGAQYATGDQWRNNSRKNEGMEPKQEQYPVVEGTGDRSKVQCCKEQYCIGTWNVRSINQGKLEVVKQEMAKVNINILGIIKLRWTGMGEFNSDYHYIYYCGQESLRRNGVAIIVNQRVQNAELGCSFKNDRMISVHFQGKPFNIMMIQVYALTRNTEEDEVEQFNEDLQDLLELTPQRYPFHYKGLKCKSRKSRNTWSNRQIWPWSTE